MLFFKFLVMTAALKSISGLDEASHKFVEISESQ